MAMCAFPTIKMVSESLKRFCEASGAKLPSMLSPEVANKTIKIDFEKPLPPYWVQSINIKTGDVYYINTRTGLKTAKNPFSIPVKEHFYDLTFNMTPLKDSKIKVIANSSITGHRISRTVGRSSSDGSPHNQQHSSLEEFAEPENYLVAVGCKACVKYMMVTRGTCSCPKCGSASLVEFTRGQEI